ncbi:hypothetical protein T4D_15377 [Trichinella pseudospiralis]|uniref:Uncharacterized protein n=1 Tax=Trichinella pseudospiralis TaxID=6337 RepID=A0A0V1FGD7_TRIPS|nr:hypothetical protein T4D_15377 [Trichinella pseudospiralis]
MDKQIIPMFVANWYKQFALWVVNNIVSQAATNIKLVLLLCYCMRDGLGDWYMPSADATHAFKSPTLYGHFKEAYVHRQKGSNRATKGSDEGVSSSEDDEDDTYFNITLLQAPPYLLKFILIYKCGTSDLQ